MNQRLKLWLIERTDNYEGAWGENVSAVVACSEDRLGDFILYLFAENDKDVPAHMHVAYNGVHVTIRSAGSQCPIDQVKHTYLGDAAPDIVQERIICVNNYGS